MSCEQSTNQLKFGLGGCLTLENGEVLTEADEEIESIILNQHEIEGAKKYLNKIIEGKDKLSLVSFSTSMNALEIIEFMEADTTFKIVKSEKRYGKNELYDTYLVEKDGVTFYRVIFTEPKFGNSIIYDEFYKDQQLAEKNFSIENYITQRINCD